MVKQNLFNIFFFEFMISINVTIRKLVFLFGLVLVFAIRFFERANCLLYSPSIGDCVLYIMKGNSIYIPTPGNPFEIPIMWFLIYLTIFFIIADYSNVTFHMLGKQSFVKIKNRIYWWYSKCMVCFCVSILSYAAIMLAILLVSICYGTISFKINNEIAEVISDIRIIGDSGTMSVWIVCIIVPLFTVYVLGMIQVIVSMLSNSIYAYLLVCIYLIASAYYCNYYFLVANFMIPIRNKVMNYGGYSSAWALGVNTCLFFLMFHIGKKVLRKYEVK